jgi:hypothetical protein
MRVERGQKISRPGDDVRVDRHRGHAEDRRAGWRETGERQPDTNRLSPMNP